MAHWRYALFIGLAFWPSNLANLPAMLIVAGFVLAWIMEEGFNG